MIKEIKANIDYTDMELKKDVEKDADIIALYEEAKIELKESRIEELENGNESSNYVPFIIVTREDPLKNDEEDSKLKQDDEEDDKPKKVKGKKISKKENEE